MREIKLILIVLLINSLCGELYKGIKSKCTKNLDKENIDGTIACLWESDDIYVPYFGVKNYTNAIKAEDCEKAKLLFQKFKRDKRFIECHKRWNVELID